MDTSILQKMLETKKKSKPNKEQRDLFQEQLQNLLNEEGLSENAIYFILGGIPYGSPSVLAEHILVIKPADRPKSIDMIVSQGKNNHLAVLRALASLLTLFSYEGDEHAPMLKKIITQIYPAAKTKKDALHADTGKYLIEGFVFRVDPALPLLSLENIGLSPAALESFKGMMQRCLEGIQCNSAREYAQVQSIAVWLGMAPPSQPTQATLMPDGSSPALLAAALQAAKGAAPTVQTKPVSIENPPFASSVTAQEMSLRETAAYLTSLADNLRAADDRLDLLEEEKMSLSIKLDASLRSLSDLKEQQHRASRKIVQLKADLQKEQIRADELTRQQSAAEQSMEEQNVRLAEAFEQLARQASVISAYAADKQASLSAQMGALGFAMRLDYEDFQAALDIPMSVELGENLRGQLQNIFMILRKNGIHFDGE